MMDRKTHWDRVYHDNAATTVGWYQETPEQSLKLIQSAQLPSQATIFDVGGGASFLVDHLLNNGFERITVLDLSREALEQASRRLGSRAAGVTWLDADITEVQLPENAFDLWHDRAVFHFLTQPLDRSQYRQRLAQSLRPGGYVVMATFAPDGPPTCSGLPVARYSPDRLQRELGSEFELLASIPHHHQTPSGASQSYIYCLFKKAG